MTPDAVSLPLVEVLMSTFNGERYVREQIDSILGQEDVRLRLIIRDDGSSDGTLDILSSYATDPRIEIRPGDNLGLPHAFFRLIQESSDDADLWALADQDDVWLPEKLSRAANLNSDVDEPVLYCARVLVVDEALRPLYCHPIPKRGPSFANALVQNIATGCTIVFNGAARNVLRDRWPSDAVMHDAWLYLVISGTGTVVYDPDPVVLYRQHADNAVGMGGGRLRRLRARVLRQLTPGEPGAHGRQDGELLRSHLDSLHPCARNQLESALCAWNGGLWGRLHYAVRGGAHRQTLGSDVVMRLLQVVGRL